MFSITDFFNAVYESIVVTASWHSACRSNHMNMFLCSLLLISLMLLHFIATFLLCVFLPQLFYVAGVLHVQLIEIVAIFMLA